MNVTIYHYIILGIIQIIAPFYYPGHPTPAIKMNQTNHHQLSSVNETTDFLVVGKWECFSYKWTLLKLNPVWSPAEKVLGFGRE